jgi:hypothetical protein
MGKTWFSVLAETHTLPDGSDETNAAAWGVPEKKVADLGPLIGACSARLAKLDDPDTDTAPARAECNAAFDEYDALMQDIHSYFYHKDFPLEALARLGLLPHKKPGKGGSVADPTDHVEIEFVIDPESHTIVIKFRIPGSKHWGKGRYHCVEIRYWILPLDAPAPLDANAPGWKSDADTSSPWEITCDGSDAGKRFWVSMRWENASTGEKNQKRGKGPWSALRSVIIP